MQMDCSHTLYVIHRKTFQECNALALTEGSIVHMCLWSGECHSVVIVTSRVELQYRLLHEFSMLTSFSDIDPAARDD